MIRRILARGNLPWVFTTVASVTFIVLGLTYLGFARDDWSHYTGLRDLFDRESVPSAVWNIVTNEWFGAHEARVFFGAFLVHGLIVATGPAAPFLAYFVQLTMFAASAAIAGWIIARVTGSKAGGAIAVGLLLVTPSVAQPALWINNLFFVQPWFFLVVAVWAWLVLGTRPGLRAAAVTALALCAQFSGEATIAPLYWVLLVLAVIDWTRSVRLQDRLRAITPLAVSGALLVVYVVFVMARPKGLPLDFGALRGFGTYLAGFRNQFVSLTDVTSDAYGVGGGVAYSWVAVVGALVIVTAVGAGAFLVPMTGRPSVRAATVGLVVAVGGATAAFAPMMAGVVAGSRPGPDLRYQYIFGQFLVIAVVLAAIAAAGLVSRAGRWSFRIVGLGALAYASMTTAHNVVDVWGLQASIDDRMWTLVDKAWTRETRVVVTYNPHHQYLMAPYHSNAVSDFQADWGVGARRVWLYPYLPRPAIFRDAQLLPGGRLALRGYYGVDACARVRPGAEKRGAVLYTAFNYGPSFAGLMTDQLFLSRAFSAFARERARIDATAPGTVPWTRQNALRACRNGDVIDLP